MFVTVGMCQEAADAYLKVSIVVALFVVALSFPKLDYEFFSLFVLVLLSNTKNSINFLQISLNRT